MQYESSAYLKYEEFEKQINKHPVKFIEKYSGIKIKWYQKIYFFICYKIVKWKKKRRKRSFDKIINRYMNVK
jgi:hypothetical protein